MSSGLNNPQPPEPPTLESLQSYTSGQTGLINSLLDPQHPNSRFRDTEDKFLVEFWTSSWGKKLDSLNMIAVVGRGSDRIDDTLLLPDVVPVRHYVMPKPGTAKHCWDFDLRCKNILIRSEYKEAEDFILSNHGADNVLITGQPGIGKSIFLFRILLRRLALRLPTALQTTPDSALLFYEGGVGDFTQLNNGPAYNQLESTQGSSGRIWALVDSNRQLHEPAAVFQRGPFFVIEASSPHPTPRVGQESHK